MHGIVPRWEWRNFGERFGDAEAVLSTIPPELVRETDELYLLSPGSDASVKVRDQLMDVKQLQHVNADGLEQWRPVMKAEFPLNPDDVRFVLDALHAAAPVDRSTYETDDLAEPRVDRAGAQAARSLSDRRRSRRAQLSWRSMAG